MSGKAEARKWESSLWHVGSHILSANSGIFLGKGHVTFKSLVPVSHQGSRSQGKARPAQARPRCHQWLGSMSMFPGSWVFKELKIHTGHRGSKVILFNPKKSCRSERNVPRVTRAT